MNRLKDFWSAWSLRIVVVVAIAAFSYVSWLRIHVHDVEEKLKTANATIHTQETIIAEISRVAVNDAANNREVSHASETIAAAPGSETLVPSDVASAWSDGIDSVRAQTPR